MWNQAADRIGSVARINEADKNNMEAQMIPMRKKAVQISEKDMTFEHLHRSKKGVVAE